MKTFRCPTIPRVRASSWNMRYQVSTTLSARVGYLNPGWNQHQHPPHQSPRANAAFAQVCGLLLYTARCIVLLVLARRSC